MVRSGWFIGICHGQHDGENGALLTVRFHPNSTPVALYNRADDGQSETGASSCIVDVARPVKFIEDVWQVDRRNADAAVGEFNDDLILLKLSADRDPPARLRIFDGIIDQMLEHLTDLYRIAKEVRQVIG